MAIPQGHHGDLRVLSTWEPQRTPTLQRRQGGDTHLSPGYAAAARICECRRCSRAPPAAGRRAGSSGSPGCPAGTPGSGSPGWTGPDAPPRPTACGTGGDRAMSAPAGTPGTPVPLRGPQELTVTCVQDWICWMSRIRYCQARRLRRSWCSCCHSPSSRWWVVSSLWGRGVRGGMQGSPGGVQGHCAHLCTASRASLLGGGRRKQTEGTTASLPAALSTRHCCGCAWFTRAQVSFLCTVTCGAGGQGGVRALVPICASPLFPSVPPYSRVGLLWSQSGWGTP